MMKKLLAIAVVAMMGGAAWAQTFELPYVAEMTDADHMALWTIVNANGDQTAGGAERTWTIDTSNGEVACDVFASSNDDYIFTPGLNCPKGKLKLSYQVHGYNGRYCDSYEVLLATSTTVDATTAPGTVIETLAQNEIQSAMGVAREVEFNTPAAGVYYIAFHDNSTDPWAVHISGVQVEVVDALTGINDILNAHAVSTSYYNLAGMQSTKPFNGVNIVVTKMADGTVKTTKAMY